MQSAGHNPSVQPVPAAGWVRCEGKVTGSAPVRLPVPVPRGEHALLPFLMPHDEAVVGYVAAAYDDCCCWPWAVLYLSLLFACLLRLGYMFCGLLP